MSFWDRVKAVLPMRVIILPWERGTRFGKAPPGKSHRELINRNESWVYRCAGLNSTSLSSVPLRLYVHGKTARFPTKELEPRRRAHIGRLKQAASEEITELTSHPLLDLLHDANPQQTGVELLELTGLYQELTGNAYWYIEPGPLGVPKSIWPLMAQYTTIVPGEDAVQGYLYGRVTSEQVAYDKDEVIHFRYPNPGDAFYGLGPLQAALKAVDRNISMAQYQQEFFDNSARIDFAITVPEGTPEAERNRLLKQWAEKYQGKDKRHLPGILMGDMDIKTFSFSPQDAVLIEAQKFSREEIAGIFGIPMSFLEISAARAEAEAHQWLYAQYTLTPRLRRMEQVLNERLVSRYDDRLFLAFDDCVPENVQQEIDEHDKYMRNWSMSINEVRAERGLAAVAWGDMPLNYTTGMPILTESPTSRLIPGIGRQAEYCPTCKSYHTKSSPPPLTDKQRELQEMAEAWYSGMRREVLNNIDAMGA